MSLAMMGGLGGMANAAGAGSGGSSAAIPTAGSVATGLATNADQFAKSGSFLKNMIGGGGNKSQPQQAPKVSQSSYATKATQNAPTNAFTPPPLTPEQLQEFAMMHGGQS